ncbi:hypothetical protein ACH5RR_015351 [Cinchona calisaya]|uniref:Uncharacterized protein n=1 Tax=Cinchona calisaya TaxID=153742 RepID=A0ABD2ZVL3_9GENT
MHSSPSSPSWVVRGAFFGAYCCGSVCDFSQNYPLLARYFGILPENITIFQTRLVFRSEQHVEYYSNLLEHYRDMEFLDIDELSLGPSVVNEPSSKVLSPFLIGPELSIDLSTNPVDTQMTKVSRSMDILSDIWTKEEVSLICISKKMVTNLGTQVDKFSRDFIIGSFQGIVKLMTSSDLSELFKS